MGNGFEFGIIFCSRCGSRLVDSGFDTKEPASLRCCECGNTGRFRVGRVEVPLTDPLFKRVEELYKEAYRDTFRYPPDQERSEGKLRDG